MQHTRTPASPVADPVAHVVCCSCRCSCCLRGLRLPPTVPPLLYKLLLTMTQDHRTSQESLAVQASRATGALAGQRPAPGPCGPVARLPKQFVVIDGVRLSVTTLALAQAHRLPLHALILTHMCGCRVLGAKCSLKRMLLPQAAIRAHP
jgi:hypothetical protein